MIVSRRRPTAVRPADQMKSSSSNSSVRDYKIIILPSVHYHTSTQHQDLRRPPFIICNGIVDMGSACCTAQKGLSDFCSFALDLDVCLLESTSRNRSE